MAGSVDAAVTPAMVAPVDEHDAELLAVVAEENEPLVAPETDSRPRESIDGPHTRALVSIDGLVRVHGACNVDPFRAMRVLALDPGGEVPIEIASDGRFRAELRLPVRECSGPLRATLDDPAGDWIKSSVALQRAATSAVGELRYEGSVAFELPDWCILLGQVVDEREQPIAGVAVSLLHDPVDTLEEAFESRRRMLRSEGNPIAPIARAETDPEGRFALRMARGERALVLVDHPRMRPVFAAADTTGRAVWDVGSLVLREGARITGHVVLNELERKFAGQGVTATREAQGYALTHPMLRYDGNAIWRSPVSSTTVDDAFELYGLEPGPYQLELAAPGEIWWSPHPPASPMTVAAPASGVIIDAQQPEIWIHVQSERTGQLMNASFAVAFGADAKEARPADSPLGLFRVAPGELYRFTVSSPGFESREVELVAPALDGFVEQVVSLRSVSTGSLLLVLGEPWSGSARLILKNEEQHLSQRVEFADGRVEVLDLVPGDYQGELELSKAGVLQGRAEGATVFLSFEARIESNAVAEPTLGPR